MVSSFTPVDAATTIMFTDSNLAGVVAKAVHITQLQTAVNAMRAAAGLAAIQFTDISQAQNRTIRAAHVNELRTALDAARARIGLPTIFYTDGTITASNT